VGLTENARHENVILKLPPHTSHVLQPMALCIFRPLKLMWDEEIIKWQRKRYARKLPKINVFIHNIEDLEKHQSKHYSKWILKSRNFPLL
jgi:hypothetical protein